MRKFLFNLLPVFLLTLLFQGCGLDGAYMYFGDQSMSDYRSAKRLADQKAMTKALKSAIDSYKQALNYNETQYPELYIKIAEAQALRTGKYDESISILNQGKHKLKDNPELKAQLGYYTFMLAKSKQHHYTGKNKYNVKGKKVPVDEIMDQAKSHYKDALTIDSINPEFNAGLAEIYFWEIDRNINQGKIKPNRFLYSKIDELVEAGTNPENPHISIIKTEAILAFLQKEYQASISKLNEVLKKESENAPTHERTLYYLCRAYVETKKYDEAIETADRALALFPDNVKFLGEKILANFLKGQGLLAQADIEEMNSLTDNYHEFYFRLGKYFSKHNKIEKARTYLLKAYRLQQENAKYAFALGNHYIMEKNIGTAKNFFNKAVKLALPGSELEKEARHALASVE
jgi:tetratricopeptide (TPR) repeat protein